MKLMIRIIKNGNDMKCGPSFEKNKNPILMLLKDSQYFGIRRPLVIVEVVNAS